MRPVFPQPGYIGADIHMLLASRQFSYTDCYTIRTKDGSILRYSTATRNVEVFPIDDPDAIVPVVYTSNQVKVSGLKTTTGVGVEVDEQDLQLDYSPTQEYMGQPFAAAIRRGRFDGATIRRDRYFRKRPGDPWIGGTPMFIGLMSSVDRVGRSSATIKIKSDLVLLNIQMPRKLFQPSCNWTIFDTGCGLDRDAYEQDGLIGVGSTASVIVTTGLPPGTHDQFEFGVLHIEDNENVTEIRTIKAVDGVNFILAYPLDFTPGAGAFFKCYPGCIRTYERCGDFDNQDRFQAFEFVPEAETAY